MSDLPTRLNVRIPFDLTDQTLTGLWSPNQAERRAAWELCIELSTRVAVVPLRSGEGLLEEALSSLHAIFTQTRVILRLHGPDLAAPRRGELSFAVLAGHMLNQVIRPVTAYWHPELEAWNAKRKPQVGKREHENDWTEGPKLRNLLDALRQPLTAYAVVFAEASGAGEFVRIQRDNETRLYEQLTRDKLQRDVRQPD